MNHPAILKYVLYGLLGFELSQIGAGVENPLWFIMVLITVILIENLGILASRRN
jgi:hypothetical protein